MASLPEQDRNSGPMNNVKKKFQFLNIKIVVFTCPAGLVTFWPSPLTWRARVRSPGDPANRISGRVVGCLVCCNSGDPDMIECAMHHSTHCSGVWAFESFAPCASHSEVWALESTWCLLPLSHTRLQSETEFLLFPISPDYSNLPSFSYLQLTTGDLRWYSPLSSRTRAENAAQSSGEKIVFFL